MNCVTLATKARALVSILIVSVAIMGTALAEERTLYTRQADGLACPFCAYGVEKQLSRIDGVDTVSTDIESGTVLISMKPGTKLTQEQAAAAVDKAGFTMRGFQEPGR